MESVEMDDFFRLSLSTIIFFMQCGFAFMEAGAVRSKNTVNILLKNWLDLCIGAIIFWASGFALMNGRDTGSGFVGFSYFFGRGLPDSMLSQWLLKFVFAATASTLVSGSLAERCNFTAYVVYSTVITGFVYPVSAHWCWHPAGWLNANGFHDHAGSGVVHLCGATIGLVGCILMGPRIGRFDSGGRPVSMPGHSVPLAALGAFILVFGFLASNGAKQGSISNPGDGARVTSAMVNTALGTSAAGIATLVFSKVFSCLRPRDGGGAAEGKYSFLTTMNGSLAGAVAMCAGSDVFPMWSTMVIGAVSGLAFLAAKRFFVSLKIDDPLDAVPVHGVGGVVGLSSVYVFHEELGLLFTWHRDSATLLAWNLVGMCCIAGWAAANGLLIFYTLDKLGMLRVAPDMEFRGMDILKHGESAYPVDAWIELQYGGRGGGGVANGYIAATKQKQRRRRHSLTLLPSHMKGHPAELASYNDPALMFPSAARLFSSANWIAIATTSSDQMPQQQPSESNDVEKLQHESLIVELGAALEAAANAGGAYGSKTAI